MFMRGEGFKFFMKKIGERVGSFPQKGQQGRRALLTKKASKSGQPTQAVWVVSKC